MDNITVKRAWCEYWYYVLDKKLREIKDHLGLLLISRVSVDREGTILDISTFIENKDHYLNLDKSFIHGSC
uniref:Uncharacterized protein n=1 Tax=viral metagenome TaxID=1070528 RepID=A0A6H1ZMA1_9ZZZZ